MKSLEERDKISDIPVEKLIYHIDHLEYEVIFICECGYGELNNNFVFCPMCGQRLNWEG